MGPTQGVPVNPLPAYLYEDEWDEEPGWENTWLMERDASLGAVLATKPFFFLIYDGTIGPQQTDRGQVIVQEDCWIIGIMASSAQAAGFAAQLFLPGEQISFSDDDIQNQNISGTGQRPFYLKSPQHIDVGDQLESRVINQAAVANAIQIVGLGLRPDSRKKIT